MDCVRLILILQVGPFVSSVQNTYMLIVRVRACALTMAEDVCSLFNVFGSDECLCVASSPPYCFISLPVATVLVRDVP